jgi:hypothetical protein
MVNPFRSTATSAAKQGSASTASAIAANNRDEGERLIQKSPTEIAKHSKSQTDH